MRALSKIVSVCIVFALLVGAAFVAFLYFVVTQAPAEFTSNQFLEVEKGATLDSIATTLEEKNIISSANIFKLGVYITGKQEQLKFGTYYFPRELRMEEVVRKIINGDFDVPTKRVTILEGQAAFQYASTIAAALPLVETQALFDLVQSQRKEGYLYPDTYFFPQNATEQDVIQIMEKNFNKKIAPYQSLVDSSGYSLDQVVTMASLVENEAGSASYETKQRVAGVLWKRVEVGMLIQADAVFPFIFQEHLPRVLNFHLEVDSPYNLYKNTGLPPGPIGSPSIDSIRAALEPVITNDLFYLTGFDGKFYYAQTNSGHERNRRLHLNYRN